MFSPQQLTALRSHPDRQRVLSAILDAHDALPNKTATSIEVTNRVRSGQLEILFDETMPPVGGLAPGDAGVAMPSSLWRAVGFTLPEGELVVEIAHSGPLVRHIVSLQTVGETRRITSLSQLASALTVSGGSAEQLASDDPAGFAFLVCILSDRPHHVFPRDTMWPELEAHFGLEPSANQPRIENGKFSFVVYSQYMPTLRVSRLTVDLKTLRVDEEELVNAQWPPTV